MTENSLDNPIWHSLGSSHARFAVGTGPVRRFLPEIGPLAGLRDMTAESLAALGDCVSAFGPVMISVPEARVAEFLVPSGVRVAWARGLAQMVGETVASAGEAGVGIVPLGEADAPEMLALATLTRPAPFGARTHELGPFWGVRQRDRLIAMAGERLRLPGFAEISAICTHPDHRGQGLGRAMTRHVMRAIRDRGETPILHVFSDNSAAVKLYEALGFRRRLALRVMALEAA